jgi:FkbM family methyltransferase
VEWVLDIGANKGDVALAALKSYPSCKVICFEPVQATFDLLQKNLKTFADRTFLYRNALAETEGTGEINITSFHGANSILPQSSFHKQINPHIGEVRKEPFSLVRLADIAAQFPATHIDVMKIDVEGY